MAIPVFPSLLKRGLCDAYGFAPRPGTVRTEMDSGQARMRRRFRRTPYDSSLHWNMTGIELAIFEAFWHETIDEGTAWFSITLYNGYDDSLVTARGTAPYDVSETAPGLFRVNWLIEVDRFSRMTGDDILGLASETPSQLAIDAPSLHQLVHVDYPATALAPLGP